MGKLDPQAALDALEKYRKKRNFAVTPEPSHGGKASPHALRFVVQKHWASRLHYDFRLEFEGTLKSWAVPKGPSLDPHDKRMAVQVEDHPLSYGGFEGTIPTRQYGAGQVIVWDEGIWLPLEDVANGFRDGKLKFELQGHKLKGRWTLVRMRGSNEKQVPWLLIKEHDSYERAAADYDVTAAEPDSVKGLAAKVTKVTPEKNARASGANTPSDLPDAAIKTPLPPLLEPQLATLAEVAPLHGNWIYELKFDGYRLMTRLDKGQAHCFTRNGHDWTPKMPQLAKSLTALQLDDTWLDGELVMPDKDGIPNFQLLQGAFETRGRHLAAAVAQTSAVAPLVYYVFDIPFHAGHDLRELPLVERRALLQKLLANNRASNIRFSDAFDAPSKDLMVSACKLGFEGLIGKRSDSPYQSRRSSDWIKLKCSQRQEFLICGYTDPKGARTGLGALLLGLHDDQGRLQYVGNIGSGLDDSTLVALTHQLEKISLPSSPFDAGVRIPGKPHWVKPLLLAEVSFAEWTTTGRVRHGVFRGLRSDKKPQAITREKAVNSESLQADTDKAHRHRVPASLRITHADRVIDTVSGLTKGDLMQHYAAVAQLMLPHLKGRPVSLVRAPSGVGGELFFQKHAKASELRGIKLLNPAFDPDHEALLEIGNVTGLLSAVQMNTLEFHTWNATTTAAISSINKPDRMTFDLDPGEHVSWQQMQEAATLVRTLIEEVGLQAFLKTSGGKGLHVVVPLKKQHDWDTVKGFSQVLVRHLAKTIPQRFVAKSGPKNRVGKIFVDYLRNGFGATTVTAWSARARPGMGVSVPVAWDELPGLTSSAHWTVRNISGRLTAGNTPWAGYTDASRPLTAAMELLGFKAA